MDLYKVLVFQFMRDKGPTEDCIRQVTPMLRTITSYEQHEKRNVPLPWRRRLAFPKPKLICIFGQRRNKKHYENPKTIQSVRDIIA